MINRISNIIVICNSDIILKGLAEIVRGCQADEVIMLHQANDLIDYPHLNGNILIIMPPDVCKENGNFLKRILVNAAEIKNLLLRFDDRTENTGTALSIFESQASTVSKINEFLNSFGAVSDDKPEGDLSKRETEVLVCVARGLQNKEVADKLNISIHTVISHRKNISEKTGIKSASGLTMYAVLKKIIDIDDISTSDLI